MAKLKQSDLKIGGTYRMKTDQYNGYGYAKGDLVTIVYLQQNNLQIKKKDEPNSQQIGCYVSNLDWYQRSKTEIEKEIVEAKLLVAEGEAKLKWMAATNNEEFDENEFKVWHTLNIIEDPAISKAEKAKAIATLIKK